jgi:hypothetical protein
MKHALDQLDALPLHSMGHAVAKKEIQAIFLPPPPAEE